MSAQSLRAWLRSFYGQDFVTLYTMNQIPKEDLEECAEDFGLSFQTFSRILDERAFGSSHEPASLHASIQE